MQGMKLFLQKDHTLLGTIVISDCLRLIDILPKGVDLTNLTAKWHFQSSHRATPEGRRVYLKLQVSAILPLTCSRCLELVQHTLDDSATFEIVNTLDAKHPCADDVEPMLESELSTLENLIEDQLILALPLLARHSHCKIKQQHSNADKPQEQTEYLSALTQLKSKLKD